MLRQLFHRRAAGIAKPQQLRRLVERFTRGIVDRRRQAAIIAKAAHLEQLAVAAGDEEQQVRELEIGVGEPRRERMAFEMVDRDQRLARGERQPLAGEQRDHHAANQARARRRGNRVDFREGQLRLIQHAPNEAGQDLDMGSGGDLRHNAAIGLVRPRLSDDGLREDAPIAGDQRRGAVVARRFQAQNYRHVTIISPAALCLNALRCTRGEPMQGLRLGTRGSPLALAQARKVAAAIETSQRWPDGWVQIVEIRTTGDKVQDRPLADIGGKALWTKELDRALIEGEVDFCVHSMKDIESERPNDIHIAAVRPRGDVRDRIIGAASIDELKKGAIVGTSSPRRKAQLLRLRPDLEIVPLRGNVETRINKVKSGEVDATLLCAAGLKRLDINEGTAIPTERLLPAPGQAVIAMECRTNDTRTQSVLTTVNNQITYDCVRAERAFTRTLGATCHSPVAAFCAFEDGDLRLRGQLFSEDGRDMVEERVVFDCGEDEPAEELARSLLARAPESIRRLFDA